MKNDRLLSVTGALLAAILLAGCAGFQAPEVPPQVSLADLSLQGMGVFEQRYLLRLRIQNPNDVPLRIRALDYVLQLNGRDFARGVSAQSATVPAYGEQFVDVEAVSNLMGVLDQFSGLGREGGLRYRLYGGLRLAYSAERIPFEYLGDISLGGGAPGSRL